MGLSIEEVISEIQDQWMDIDGVEGIGQGKTNDKDCIVVFVSLKTPEIKKSIPSTFKEFAVKIIESGALYAEEQK
ncbi:MAG: hypothetical protein IMF01_02140 [Proteobacteria bacterium]|nr:hypothetical protein [Pseudomonadota bacterium]